MFVVSFKLSKSLRLHKLAHFYSTESLESLFTSGLSFIQDPSSKSASLSAFNQIKAKNIQSPTLESIQYLNKISIQLNQISLTRESNEYLSQSLQSFSSISGDDTEKKNYILQIQEIFNELNDPIAAWMIKESGINLENRKSFISLHTALMCAACLAEAKAKNIEKSLELLAKVKDLNEFTDENSLTGIWIVLTMGKIQYFMGNFKLSMNIHLKALDLIQSCYEEVDDEDLYKRFDQVHSIVFAKLFEGLIELHRELKEPQEAAQMALEFIKIVENFDDSDFVISCFKVVLKQLIGNEFIGNCFEKILEYCEKNEKKDKFTCFVYKIGFDMHEKKSDLGQCMMFIQKIVDLAKENKYFDELFDAYVSVGSLYAEVNSDRLQEILKLADVVLANNEVKVNKLNYFILYYKLHESQNNIKKSQEIIETILSYPQFSKSDPQLALNLLEIFSNFFKTNQNHELTLRVLEKSLEFISKIQESHIQKCKILEEISETYFKMKNINKSISFLEESIQLSLSSGLQEISLVVYRTIKLSSLIDSINEKLQAINCISRIEHLLPHCKANEDLAQLYYIAGSLYFDIKDLKNSEKYLKIASNLYSSLGLYEDERITNNFLKTFESNHSSIKK